MSSNRAPQENRSMTKRPPVDLTQFLPSSPIQKLAELRETWAKLAGHANVLTPVIAVDKIMPMHEVAIHAETIDIEPRAMQVYKGSFCEKDERALTHIALNLLATAAGVQPIDSESGRVDDRREPSLFCEFKVTLELTHFDGTKTRKSATESLDLHDGAPETLKEEWVPDPQNPGHNKRTGNMIAIPAVQLNAKRRKIQRLCESFAWNACMRKLLSLKQKYTLLELEKPFVMPRLVSALDPDDPFTHKALVAAALGQSHLLYGAPERGREPDAIDLNPDAEFVTAISETDEATGEAASTATVEENLEGWGAPEPERAQPEKAEAKQSEEPLYVCACVCGHQRQIPKKVYEFTRAECDSERCGQCFPWNPKYDPDLHKDFEKLGLPKFPNLTTREAAEISQTFVRRQQEEEQRRQYEESRR